MKSSSKKILQVSFPFVIGAVAAIYLPADAYDQAGDTIATFSGFVAAAVVPAAVLVVTLLKSSGLKLAEIKSYRFAINEQLNFLFSILLASIVLVLIIIFCKLLKWENYYIIFFKYKINIFYTLNFIITFLLLFVFLGFLSFFTAMKSMFKLHADIVETELKQKQDRRLNNTFDSKKISKDPRNNFGREINLP